MCGSPKVAQLGERVSAHKDDFAARVEAHPRQIAAVDDQLVSRPRMRGGRLTESRVAAAEVAPVLRDDQQGESHSRQRGERRQRGATHV